MYEGIKEFASRTGFKYSAIRLLCLQGKLPFVQIGRKRMIHIEPALDALEQMAKGGTTNEH